MSDIDQIIESIRNSNGPGGISRKDVLRLCDEFEALQAKLLGLHKQHPNSDYCTYCHSQWPCEESLGNE